MKKGKVKDLIDRLKEINNIIDNAPEDKYTNYNFHFDLSKKLGGIIYDSRKLVNPNKIYMDVFKESVIETKKKINLVYKKISDKNALLIKKIKDKLNH